MKLFKALIQGGPVGLAHTVREAWIARRIRQVSALMDQERELHRMHTQQLRTEFNRLLLRQAHITQRATSFWRALS